MPLRSGKTTPYEGGVRVPGFAVDFTEDARYFGRPRALVPTSSQPVKSDTNTESADATSAAAAASAPSAAASQQHAPRAFNGMMHISDWLPTFLALAGVDAAAVAALKLDGVNQLPALRDTATPSARDEVLYAMQSMGVRARVFHTHHQSA